MDCDFSTQLPVMRHVFYWEQKVFHVPQKSSTFSHDLCARNIAHALQFCLCQHPDAELLHLVQEEVDVLIYNTASVDQMTMLRLLVHSGCVRALYGHYGDVNTVQQLKSYFGK